MRLKAKRNEGIDLVARDTIDERIAAALQSKRATATEILDAL